jgi:hypothetical protein
MTFDIGEVVRSRLEDVPDFDGLVAQINAIAKEERGLQSIACALVASIAGERWSRFDEGEDALAKAFGAYLCEREEWTDEP